MESRQLVSNDRLFAEIESRNIFFFSRMSLDFSLGLGSSYSGNVILPALVEWLSKLGGSEKGW